MGPGGRCLVDVPFDQCPPFMGPASRKGAPWLAGDPGDCWSAVARPTQPCEPALFRHRPGRSQLIPSCGNQSPRAVARPMRLAGASRIGRGQGRRLKTRLEENCQQNRSPGQTPFAGRKHKNLRFTVIWGASRARALRRNWRSARGPRGSTCSTLRLAEPGLGDATGPPP